MVMAECLVEAAGAVASPPGQRLAHLVYETGACETERRSTSQKPRAGLLPAAMWACGRAMRRGGRRHDQRLGPPPVLCWRALVFSDYPGHDTVTMS